jgi:hypothetical protein
MTSKRSLLNNEDQGGVSQLIDRMSPNSAATIVALNLTTSFEASSKLDPDHLFSRTTYQWVKEFTLFKRLPCGLVYELVFSNLCCLVFHGKSGARSFIS